ncbi:MAG TPA: hypothetical protein VGE36_14210 [Roseateles sp.]
MTPGQGKELMEAGDFFRIIASPAEDVAIIFYKDGREVGRVEDVGAGYWERCAFDKVRITSGTGGQVRAVARIGAEVGYDRAVGGVNIVGTVVVKDENGAFSHAAPAVLAAGGQLVAANASRRYLLVQNNHGTQTVWVRIDGLGVNIATTGVRLKPGESLEIQGRAPTAAVFAITTVDIAAGGGVIVVEG